MAEGEVGGVNVGTLLFVAIRREQFAATNATEAHVYLVWFFGAVAVRSVTLVTYGLPKNGE